MSDRSRLRLLVLQVLVLSLLVTLLARLWSLQVMSGEEYQVAAESNRVRDVVTQPVRGLILDDQGRPLVRNRTTLVVSVDRTELGRQPDDGAAVLARLAAKLGTTPVAIVDRITLCGTEGAKKPPVCWNGSPYQPVPVARDVPTEVALSIMERREDYPGVSAELEAVREYPEPAGANAAHLVGYIGPVTDEEVAASQQGDNPLHRSDLIGRAGLEAVYDEQLRGVPGVKQLAVDRSGAVTGTIGETAAVPGSYLVTSIDAKVQAVAEKALLDQITAARKGETYKGPYKADSGAAVVLDVRTGRVVAMASYPSYDPSVWVGGISEKEYAALTDEAAGTPLLSRAVSGEFAPASTFKVVSTSAAVQAGYSTSSSYPCTSTFSFGNTSKRNYESRPYGNISLARALEVSCNTVFYKLGYDTWLREGGLKAKPGGREVFVSTARGFGYGAKTGVDLPAERPGRIVSRADRLATWQEMKDIWCSRAKTGYPEESNRAKAAYLTAIAKENCADGWQYRGGDAVNFVIGQGDTLVTPLQVARTYAAIANGGTLWTPQVAKAVVRPDGTVVEEFTPRAAGRLTASAATIRYLQQALRGVATDGTARGVFADFPVAVSAKTGSGQVTGKQDTSWFASYAPSNNPQYAVVMMISQGGTGSGTSAPGVRAIYEALFGVKGSTADPKASVLPGGRLPTVLPTITEDGRVLQPGATAPPRASAAPSATASPTPTGTPAAPASAAGPPLALLPAERRGAGRGIAGVGT